MGKAAHFPGHEREWEYSCERAFAYEREGEGGREAELGHHACSECAFGHEREQDAGVAALLRERLRDAARDRKNHLATFSRYYESRDRKLCVFEDEHGHLTSVRADRLA